MKHVYTLALACGHEIQAKMTFGTAKYRREWLADLPMDARCNACRKQTLVTRIYRNSAEELLDAKAAEA
jgi:hypothetical protein